MADWITLDLSQVELIQQIKDGLDTISPPISAILTALGLTQDVLQVLLVVLELISSLDPQKAIIAALEQLLQSITNDTAYMLLLKPISVVDPISYIYKTVEEAMYDTSDINRPPFTVGQLCGGFVMFASAPNLTELTVLINSFKKLIKSCYDDLLGYIDSINNFAYPNKLVSGIGTITGFQNADKKSHFLDSNKIQQEGIDLYSGYIINFVTGKNANRWNKISTFDSQNGLFELNKEYPFEMEIGDTFLLNLANSSGSPDWEKMDITSMIPIFGTISSFLSTVINTMKGAPSLSDVANKVGQNIVNKIAQLQNIINQILVIKQMIEDFLKINNVNILPIVPLELGNMGFIQSIRVATNPPQVAQNSYIIGAAVCGGASLYPTIKLLFGL